MRAGARRAMTNGRPSSSARSDQPASTGAAGDDYVVAMCARALGHPGPFRCGRSSVQGEKPRNLLPVDYYSHSTVVLVPASNIFFPFSPFFPFFHSLFPFFLLPSFARQSDAGVLCFSSIFSNTLVGTPFTLLRPSRLAIPRHPTPSHAIPFHSVSLLGFRSSAPSQIGGSPTESVPRTSRLARCRYTGQSIKILRLYQ